LSEIRMNKHGMEKFRWMLVLTNMLVREGKGKGGGGGGCCVLAEGGRCFLAKHLRLLHGCGCEGGGWFLLAVYGSVWGGP